MRHGKKFNHLSRKPAHRKALLKNLGKSLILKKRIVTTLPKAKEFRKFIEPILTKSKTDTTHSRRVVFSYFQDKEPVKELFDNISKKIDSRPGGYTRIIKLSDKRKGDNSEMCIIELVDYNKLAKKVEKTAKSKTRRSRMRSKKQDSNIKTTETNLITDETKTINNDTKSISALETNKSIASAENHNETKNEIPQQFEQDQSQSFNDKEKAQTDGSLSKNEDDNFKIEQEKENSIEKNIESEKKSTANIDETKKKD